MIYVIKSFTLFLFTVLLFIQVISSHYSHILLISTQFLFPLFFIFFPFVLFAFILFSLYQLIHCSAVFYHFNLSSFKCSFVLHLHIHLFFTHFIFFYSLLNNLSLNCLLPNVQSPHSHFRHHFLKFCPIFHLKKSEFPSLLMIFAFSKFPRSFLQFPSWIHITYSP